MEAYRTHYRHDCGLTVRDWRFAARVCNIDVSALTTDGTRPIAPPRKRRSSTSWCRPPSASPVCRRAAPSGYVNRTIREQLRLGILEKIAGNLAWETVAGKRVMTFDDIPVKRLDAINNTEARVVQDKEQRHDSRRAQ